MNKNMKNYKGFSLIELLVAMAIGLVVLLGVVTIFSSSSSVNKSQSGLALLQENGRYAISRIKLDIQSAGRKHCATVAMPSEYVTNWDQGYAMSDWRISDQVNFSNGLPNVGDVEMDLDSDNDQLPDTFDLSTFNSFPLDPSYFIRGFDCQVGICTPDMTEVGGDMLTSFGSIGTNDGSRADNSDVLTVRYLSGGFRVTSKTGNSLTLADPPPTATGDALVADCDDTFVGTAAWSGSSVTVNNLVTGFKSGNELYTETRAYRMEEDFKTVSYFLGIDEDENAPGRMISSLYRSENGLRQQLVEGVERFEVFYLAQLQTGHVVRLTADQVDQVSGGGDADGNGAVDQILGCTLQPTTEYITGAKLANGRGCLWRSVYAVEVHLLLNTVNNSATTETEPFVFTPDGANVQTPPSTLPNGLNRERMYRREFTAIVPIRSYTL